MHSRTILCLPPDDQPSRSLVIFCAPLMHRMGRVVFFCVPLLHRMGNLVIL